VSVQGERRRGPRVSEPDTHGIVKARMRPGREVAVIDVSAGGALIETEQRLLPGTAIDLHLTTPERNVAMRGRVLRCTVARLRSSSVSYRGAIGFDRSLPWLADAEGDDVAGESALGGELRARRAGRALGSPAIVA